MRARLLSFVFLSACSVLDPGLTIESAVILGANETKALRVRTAAPDPIAVDLRGRGPGAVTFDARSPSGSSTSQGVLATESTAYCHTNEGELVVTFTADALGGAVEYTVHAANGASVTATTR